MRQALCFRYSLVNEQDTLAHAIADAEYVLLCHRLEESSSLPWTAAEADLCIDGICYVPRCFWYCPSEDACYSVSTDNLLTEQDVCKHLALVEAADRKEVASFVENKCFKLRRRSKEHTWNQVDGAWVRKWGNAERTLVKSRCCSKGFTDRQKGKIQKHNSTASRLSHRLSCSLGMQYRLEVESLDISTAFLQGLRFGELRQKALDLGYGISTDRRVWFKPPANFWRHLQQIKEADIYIEDHQVLEWILELVKASYGLIDGQILFQMALLHFLVHNIGMTGSVHDANFLTMCSGRFAGVVFPCVW